MNKIDDPDKKIDNIIGYNNPNWENNTAPRPVIINELIESIIVCVLKSFSKNTFFPFFKSSTTREKKTHARNNNKMKKMV